MTSMSYPAEMWEEIRTDLLSTPELERAAVAFAGHVRTSRGVRLLLRDWWPVPPSEYLVQLGAHLEIGPAFWARAAKRARKSGESLVIMHSHPKAEGTPRFSASDLRGERLLVPRLQARAQVRVATVVVGPDGASASHYAPASTQRRPLPLQTVGSFGMGTDVEGRANDPTSRQMLAVGAAGNAAIQDLVVGVVGLGGLGSHVSAQLSHLGVQQIVGVDFDRVEASNLSRLIGGRRRDSLLRRNKSSVARGIARRLGTDFKAINRRVEDPAVARELLECDVVVGCTDNQTSRAVLNQLAMQYYLPVLDLGVQIHPGKSSGGRATWLLPNSPCEWCRGILDPEVVRAEQLPAHLREIQLERGYITGLPTAQPAVVSVNGVVASLGVTELVARCTTALGGQRGDMLVYRLEDGTVRRVGGVPQPDCVTCSPSGNLGAGDLVELM